MTEEALKETGSRMFMPAARFDRSGEIIMYTGNINGISSVKNLVSFSEIY